MIGSQLLDSSFNRSLKEPSEVGKFLLNWEVLPKLESFAAAGKSWLKLESWKLQVITKSNQKFGSETKLDGHLHQNDVGREIESMWTVQKYQKVKVDGSEVFK